MFDLYEELNLVEHVREIGAYLKEQLENLVNEYTCMKERRGIGLMQGLEFTGPVSPVINKALEKGLVIISAGTNIIRFVPPLVIEKEHVDEMISILKTAVEEAFV